MKLRTKKLAPSMQSNNYSRKAVYANMAIDNSLYTLLVKYEHRPRALHVCHALKLLDDYGVTSRTPGMKITYSDDAIGRNKSLHGRDGPDRVHNHY
jgi:hypothetical protein